MNKMWVGVAACLVGVSAACGWGVEPEGVAIPAVTDDGAAWVDASGTPFVTDLQALEPRSTGIAIARRETGEWVRVDLDARPVVVTELDCDPTEFRATCLDGGQGRAIVRGCRTEQRRVRAPTRPTRERKDQPSEKGPPGIRRPMPAERQTWVMPKDGDEYAVPIELEYHDCVGGIAMVSNDAYSLIGLYRDGAWVREPFAREVRVLSASTALMLDADTDAWLLVDGDAVTRLDGLQPVQADPRVVAPWHAMEHGFPLGPAGFAARKDDTCGWFATDGTPLGGFSPGLSSCSAPADGHGFASTANGFVWLEIRGG